MSSNRDAKLLLCELADVQDALRLNLSAQERRTLEEEERTLLRILDVIEARDFERHVARLRD
jgi:hypothetical protein